MTKRKKNPLIKSSPYVERRHYACRVRLDLWDSLKSECQRLNCSQGVYLEIALQKAILGELVRPADVYSYSSSIRWFEFARNRLERGLDFFGKQLTEDERASMISLFSRVIAGEVPADLPDLERLRLAGQGGIISAVEQFLSGTQKLPVTSR